MFDFVMGAVIIVVIFSLGTLFGYVSGSLGARCVSCEYDRYYESLEKCIHDVPLVADCGWCKRDCVEGK